MSLRIVGIMQCIQSNSYTYMYAHVLYSTYAFILTIVRICCNSDKLQYPLFPLHQHSPHASNTVYSKRTAGPPRASRSFDCDWPVSSPCICASFCILIGLCLLRNHSLVSRPQPPRRFRTVCTRLWSRAVAIISPRLPPIEVLDWEKSRIVRLYYPAVQRRRKRVVATGASREMHHGVDTDLANRD